MLNEKEKQIVANLLKILASDKILLDKMTGADALYFGSCFAFLQGLINREDVKEEVKKAKKNGA